MTEALFVEVVKVIGILGAALFSAVATVRAGQVRRQMEPNGGASMRDAVDRITRRLDEAERADERWLRQYDAAERHWDERLTRIESMVDRRRKGGGWTGEERRHG